MYLKIGPYFLLRCRDPWAAKIGPYFEIRMQGSVDREIWCDRKGNGHSSAKPYRIRACIQWNEFLLIKPVFLEKGENV